MFPIQGVARVAMALYNSTLANKTGENLWIEKLRKAIQTSNTSSPSHRGWHGFICIHGKSLKKVCLPAYCDWV